MSLTWCSRWRTLRHMTGLAPFGDEIERALEKVNVPSYVLDTTGVVLWINPAALQRVGDVRGRPFTSVVAPEEQQRSREVFTRKVVGGASVTDGEFVLVDIDGNRVAVEISSVPLVRGGRVVGVFGQVTRELEASPLPAHPRLTPRQSEVLRLLEHGRSTRQIAQELHLSPETVRNHVRHVLRNLGVHSRLEAVALARASA
jgi:PAS domain S-box-containing protein